MLENIREEIVEIIEELIEDQDGFQAYVDNYSYTPERVNCSPEDAYPSECDYDIIVEDVVKINISDIVNNSKATKEEVLEVLNSRESYMVDINNEYNEEVIPTITISDEVVIFEIDCDDIVDLEENLIEDYVNS